MVDYVVVVGSGVSFPMRDMTHRHTVRAIPLRDLRSLVVGLLELVEAPIGWRAPFFQFQSVIAFDSIVRVK